MKRPQNPRLANADSKAKRSPKKKTARRKAPTTNPFLNFLRDFRNWNPKLASSQLMQKGAEFWKAMTLKQKASYMHSARTASAKKRRQGGVKVKGAARPKRVRKNGKIVRSRKLL